jgi:hypothetical protein
MAARLPCGENILYSSHYTQQITPIYSIYRDAKRPMEAAAWRMPGHTYGGQIALRDGTPILVRMNADPELVICTLRS